MNAPKIILGIESSCDETAATICLRTNKGVQILSNIVASSAALQAKYGGVIPEQAAREQLRSIIPVIQEALAQANISCHPELVSGSVDKMLKQVQHNNKEIITAVDAIAVTEGPGLIGSLLVGVETAKVLSTVWQKPLVPVNHLLGHFYANWITTVIPESKVSRESINTNKLLDPRLRGDDKKEVPKFPLIGLLVSGGHTDLVLMTDHGKYQYLGGTRDDAAGECFDKCARLLGLPYPGGPVIAKLAEKGNPKAFKLPRPMASSGDFDFSFSGLKTAVSNLLTERGVTRKRVPIASPASPERSRRTRTDDGKLERQDPERFQEKELADICASIQEAIVDVLVKKTVAAAKKYGVTQIIVAGGVAANQSLAKELIDTARSQILNVKISIPPPILCTDNAAMVASAALFNYHPVNPLSFQANPNLSLEPKRN